MKRVFIIFLAFLMLMMAGCSNGKYSMADVENALSEFPGVIIEPWSKEKLEWFEAANAEHGITVQKNTNPDFEATSIFIFKSPNKAKAFFNSYKNEKVDYIKLRESGDNYCYVKNTGVYDITVNYYFYIRDNVVFMCSVSGGETYERDLDFCKNTLPKIADSLD